MNMLLKIILDKLENFAYNKQQLRLVRDQYFVFKLFREAISLCSRNKPMQMKVKVKFGDCDVCLTFVKLWSIFVSFLSGRTKKILLIFFNLLEASSTIGSMLILLDKLRSNM